MGNKSTSKLRFARRGYYVQHVLNTKNLAMQRGRPQPPWVEFPKSFVEKAEGTLGFDALGYYAWLKRQTMWWAHWQSQDEKLLGISEKQTKRLRGVLEKHGALTRVQVGKRTFMAVHADPVSPEQHEATRRIYTQSLIAQHNLSREFGFPIDHHVGRSLSAYIGHETFNPYPDPRGFLAVPRSTLRYVYGEALPAMKGMERLKAIGLWMRLQTPGSAKNWRSPRNIARELGAHQNTITNLFKHLMCLDLVYYREDIQMVGVSLFTLDRHREFHPMEVYLRNIPWKYFQPGVMDDPDSIRKFNASRNASRIQKSNQTT